jgi:hypothetical protein
LSYLSSINFKLLKSQYEEAKDQRLETGFFPLRSQLGVCVTPQKHAFKPNPSIPSPIGGVFIGANKDQSATISAVLQCVPLLVFRVYGL